LAAANNSLAKLVRLAEAGEHIVITRNGRAIAELRRLEPQERRRGEDPVQDLIDDIENIV
jgi:prevent-host-death family protein